MRFNDEIIIYTDKNMTPTDPYNAVFKITFTYYEDIDKIVKTIESVNKEQMKTSKLINERLQKLINKKYIRQNS